MLGFMWKEGAMCGLKLQHNAPTVRDCLSCDAVYEMRASCLISLTCVTVTLKTLLPLTTAAIQYTLCNT